MAKLTKAEAAELAQLEALAAKAQPQASRLTPEEEAELAQLETMAAGGGVNPKTGLKADGLPSFAPAPIVMQKPVVSWPAHIGNAVESAVAHIPGAMRGGAAIEAGMDQVKDLVTNRPDKSYSEHYNDALTYRKEQLGSVVDVDPSAYKLGSVVENTAAAAILKVPQAYALHGAAQESFDILQDDKTANKRALERGAFELVGGQLIQGAAGAIGAGVTSLAKGPTGTKLLAPLKSLVKKFGMSETRAVKQAAEISKGTARPATNQMEATRIMAEEGVLKGNPSFEALYPKLQNVHAKYGPVIEESVEAATQKGTTAYFDVNQIVKNLVDRKKAFSGAAEKKIQALIAESGVGGQMTPKQLLEAKQVFGNEYHSALSTVGADKLDIAAKKALYRYTSELLENSVASPAFTHANRTLTAAHTFEKFVEGAYNSATGIGGNPLARAAQAGVTKPVAGLQGALKSNIGADAQLLAPGAAQNTAKFIQPFVNKAVPVIEKNPARIIEMGRMLRDLMQTKQIGIIEGAKLMTELNSKGVVPPVLQGK